MKEDRFEIRSLGKAIQPSPLPLSSVQGDQLFNFVRDTDRVIFNTSLSEVAGNLQDGQTRP